MISLVACILEKYEVTDKLHAIKPKKKRKAKPCPNQNRK